jgi:hypothetical protein
MKFVSVQQLASEFGMSDFQVRWFVKKRSIPTAYIPVRLPRGGRPKLRILYDAFCAEWIGKGNNYVR